MEESCQIRLEVKQVVRLLGGCIVLLVAGYGLTQALKFATGRPNYYGLIGLFDLDRENNFPTFFSTAQLLFAAVLVGIVAARKQVAAAHRWHWIFLALIILYLAVDEAASLHELLMRPTRELLGAWVEPLTGFSWVVPVMIMVGVVAVFLFRFWWTLPPRVRRLTFFSALLYVGGAVGGEIAAGVYVRGSGVLPPGYSCFVAVEEALEMVAILVFIVAMMRYIESRFGEVRLRFGA